MINFVDESGNVGFQINEEGLRVTDVIAGEHKLSNKMDITDNLVRVEDTDDELDDVPDDVCVKYVTQSLTEEQKNQVRENLGVPSMEYVMSLYQELLKLVQNNNGGSTTIPLATLDTAVLDNSILS
jgi:beta-glucosidase/6-phospho-beta-glucosidase/beta-galactosidase